ncbi:hypothetical protein MPSEU_000662900 [Mayamaea pseudoterrestris]|nr:hypothetical protein MPSEU_000662900 [Mayamaea pseudoterrestris]
MAFMHAVHAPFTWRRSAAIKRLCLATFIFLGSHLRSASAFMPLFAGRARTIIRTQQLASSKWIMADPPFLAVITETSACDSRDQLDHTLEALTKAVSTKQVDLVSIRLTRLPKDNNEHAGQHDRVVELARRLMRLTAMYDFRLVVSSDWVDAGAQAGVDGVHVKEAQWPSMIPEIQRKFDIAGVRPSSDLLFGTSTHSLESATRAMESTIRPNYLFVGTCYKTASHPEKHVLEGPKLPGQVARRLDELAGIDRPKVFAIGGIDEENCNEPVQVFGADGVAVIRAVSEADNPAEAVMRLKAVMAGSSQDMATSGLRDNHRWPPDCV